MPRLMIQTARQRGFGLIEVLVALLIMAIGLLGTIALQSRAMQAELESYQRVQALILLDDMANRLYANRARRDCYHLAGHAELSTNFVGIGSGVTEGDAVAELTACNQIAATDLVTWDAMLKGATVTDDSDNQVGAMVGARGCIERLDANARRFRITVAWQGMQATAEPRESLTCGAGLYGDDERMRRVVSRVVEFAELVN